MDSGVSSVVGNGIQGFSVSALSQLAEIIPIAFAVMITITLVFYSIRWFTRLAGLGHALDEGFSGGIEGMGQYGSWAERGEDEPEDDWTDRISRGWD